MDFRRPLIRRERTERGGQRGSDSRTAESRAEPSALRARPHGTCLRYEPAIESIALARRGDDVALRRLIERAPGGLDSAPHAARLQQLAVLGGRERVIDFLLDAGVDVNKPSPAAPLIFVTITPPRQAS